MLFTEVVLERVRCFKELRRFPLKPGYNLVYGASESGKTTFVETVFILLDPLRNIPEEEDVPSWGPPGKSRAGMVIQEGKESFRLTKDFVNGQVSLSRLNPQTNKYETLATDPSKIDSFLRQNLGIPPVSVYRKLFCFSREDLPTGMPKVLVQKIAIPAREPEPSAFGAGFAPAPQPVVQPPLGYGMSIEEKKRRLEELKQQRDKAKEISDLQFEIDGLEAKLFDIENKLKDISAMEDQIEQLTRAINKLRAFQELPRDVIRHIEDFEGAQREHNKTVAQFDQKIAEANANLMNIKNRLPFFKERNFLAGLGAFAAGIMLHFINMEKDIGALKGLTVIALIAGLGLVFWVIWNELNAKTQEKEAQEKFDKLTAELNEVQKKFEVEASVIKKLVQEAGVEEPKELQEKLKEYKALTEKLEEMQVRLEKRKKEIGFFQLEKEKRQYQERVEELNERLRKAGGTGFVGDLEDIQRQIDALQFSIDHPDSMPPPTPPSYGFNPGGFGGGGSSNPGGFGGGGLGNPGNPGGEDDGYLGGSDETAYNPAIGASLPNPEKTMVSTGSKLEETGQENPVDMLWTMAESFTGLDRSTLIMQINDRFNAFVKAFTNGTYLEGDLSSEKTVSLRNSMGNYIEIEKLPPSSKDAAWLALKLSLIENLFKKKVLPILMDDPLRLFDEARLANISKALKALGAKGQVILVSTQKAHSKLADNTVSLTPQPAPGS